MGKHSWIISSIIVCFFVSNFLSEFFFPLYYKSSYQGYDIWLMLSTALLIGYFLKKKSLSLAILATYLLINSTMLAYHHGTLGVFRQILLTEKAARSYGFILMASILFITVPIYRFKTALKIGHWINLLLTGGLMLAGYEYMGGISSNPSVSAASLAFTLPIFYGDKRWWLPTLLATSLVLVISRSSTAIAMLSAVAFLYFIFHRPTLKKAIISILIASVGMGVFIYLHPEYASLSGRGTVWWLTKFLADQWGIFGKGIGSYYYDFSQRMFNLMRPLPGAEFIMHPWAHNDYLQMYYESGVVGLILYLFALLSLAWTAFRYKCKVGMMGVAEYTLYAFGLFPSHVGMDLVILWYYVSLILRKRDTYDRFYPGLNLWSPFTDCYVREKSSRAW